MESLLSQELQTAPRPQPPGAGAVLKSLLECSFRPASAASRTLHVPLRTAYFVHALSALGAVLAILMAAASSEWASLSESSEIAYAVFRIVGNFLDEFVQHPLPMSLAVVGIELGYAALALGVLPWGACDEPVHESARHALRRVWMQTPQLFLFIAIMSGTIAFLDETHNHWKRAHPVDYPVMPPIPAGSKPGTPSWDQHHARMEAYHDQVRRINRAQRAAQPFHIRYDEPLAGVGCVFFGWTFLVSLLRAVGTPRHPPRIERAPRCEACGYDLTTIPMESRCPECGEAVVASLGPQARPGPPWQNRTIGYVAAWHRTWRAAVFSPAAFGRTLRVTEPGTDHRRFFLLHLPFVFALGACVPPAFFFAIEHKSPLQENAEIVFFVAPVAGLLCVAGATAATLATAGQMGLYFQWREKRNLLPAAIQVTCYLITYQLAWEFYGGVTGILAITLGRNDDFRAWARDNRLDPEMLVFIAWFVLNLAWGLIYRTLVHRAVAATRYANK